MKFLRMQWENLGIFQKRQSLILADQGLVMVRGRNLVSAAADTNGTGKTTLFSILSWILFGEGLPGQDGKVPRGDDLACRFTKGPALGILDTEDSDGIWQIERGRRPIKLAFDGAGQYWTGDQADEKIVQRVGFGALTFRNALVLGQGATDRLATADQAAYLKMLDEIQGLNFRDALDKAKVWRDEWRLKLDQLEDQLREAATVKYHAQTQIAELEQGHALFQDEKANRIRTCEDTIQTAKENLQVIEQTLSHTNKLIERAVEARENWELIKVLQAELNDNQGHYQQMLYDRDTAKIKYLTFKNDLEQLIHAQRCPTCRRKIASSSDIADVKKLFSSDDGKYKEVIQVAEKHLVDAKRAVQNSQMVLEKNTKDVGTLNERIVSELEAQCSAERLTELKEQVKKAKKYVADIQMQLKDERHATWSGQAGLDLARKHVHDALAVEETTQKEIDRVQRTLLAADYWVEAFGDRGLRSMLFDSVADFLNERLAYHLRILAAGEVDVVLSALKTLKKGTTKEQMTMTAQWHWGASSYGGSSAGQSGRVNLALVAAHQDLAESRSARPFPLRVFDEPESHCDPRGQEIISEWIMQEASHRNTTFVITHNPILADMLEPDHIVTVILERDGARIEYE